MGLKRLQWLYFDTTRAQLGLIEVAQLGLIEVPKMNRFLILLVRFCGRPPVICVCVFA